MKKTVNERIKILKDESGLGVNEFAKEVGVSPSTMSYYLKDRDPGTDILISISKHFNVSVDWLLGLVDYRSPKSSRNVSQTIEQMEQNMLPPPNKALSDILSAYEEDKEEILKQARSFKSIEDELSLFPNQDSSFGKIFDDGTLLYMITQTHMAYSKEITRLSDVAFRGEEVYDFQKMVAMLDHLQHMAKLTYELMVNYNHYVSKSVSFTLRDAMDDYLQFEDLSDYCLDQFHEEHPEDRTVVSYEALVNPKKIPLVPD